MVHSAGGLEELAAGPLGTNFHFWISGGRGKKCDIGGTSIDGNLPSNGWGGLYHVIRQL